MNHQRSLRYFRFYFFLYLLPSSQTFNLETVSQQLCIYQAKLFQASLHSTNISRKESDWKCMFTAISPRLDKVGAPWGELPISLAFWKQFCLLSRLFHFKNSFSVIHVHSTYLAMFSQTPPIFISTLLKGRENWQFPALANKQSGRIDRKRD